MNTHLTTAQEKTRQAYLEFAQQEVASKAQQLEAHTTSLKEFLQVLAQKGYLGINVPREYGGQGGSLLDLVLLVDALAHYEAGLGLTLASHAAVTEVIKRYGSESQKSRYLPILSRGEGFAGLAFTEENAGTDFEAVTTVLDSAAQPSISGKKAYVVNGDFASLLLVLAKDKSSSELKLALVDLDKQSSYKVEPHQRMLGLRSACVNNIEFTQHKINSLVENACGSKEIALYAMDVAKVILSAAALGLTESAKERAIKHARSRRQFGSAIRSFQAIQWKFADMQTDWTGATLQVWRAAWSHDNKPADFRRNAAMCKWIATRAARTHCGEALQIMGARGLTADETMERFWRDSKAMEICEGTSEFQKVLLVKELDI